MTDADERYVVFDCDIGTDDAWALIMLLKAEATFRKFKTIAVTCVFGNTDVTNVSKNAIRVLDSLDRTDIPIYRGCSKGVLPLQHLRTSFFHGKNGFGDVEHSYDVDMSRIEQTHAVTAMYEFACKFPRKVTYVLVGPLTNFAMCMNMYDDFLSKVKDVWIMGGNIRAKGNVTKSAEFNFFYDPEAAHIVLERAEVPIVILPWESCIDGDFGITWKWRKEVLGSVKSKPVDLMNYVENAIFGPKGFPNWIVCDALLMAAFLFPQKLISRDREYHATVELVGTHTRGQLVLDHLRRKDNNVRVIEVLDKDNWRKAISWTAGLPDVEFDWECFA